jgi:hypothetical protein
MSAYYHKCFYQLGIFNYFVRSLILLDTEGLNDPHQRHPMFDFNLSLLAMLLSSVFVYNSKGTIDAKSIDGLEFVTKMKETMDFHSDDIVPCFVWVLRDFFLKLELANGQKITSGRNFYPVLHLFQKLKKLK